MKETTNVTVGDSDNLQDLRCEGEGGGGGVGVGVRVG